MTADPLPTPRYSIAQAARMAGLHPARVRRWLGVGGSPPTVVRQPGASRAHVSFLDLVELDMVRSLVFDGFELRRLRAAVQDAATRLGIDHPLARRQFLCDGQRLFLDDGEALVVLGHGGRLALDRVVRERSRVIEFAPDGRARRWWPMGRGDVVVLDPDLSWGEPAIDGTRWTTHALVQAVRGEQGDVHRVATIYQIEVEKVRRAMEYEGLIAA